MPKGEQRKQRAEDARERAAAQKAKECRNEDKARRRLEQRTAEAARDEKQRQAKEEAARRFHLTAQALRKLEPLWHFQSSVRQKQTGIPLTADLHFNPKGCGAPAALWYLRNLTDAFVRKGNNPLHLIVELAPGGAKK